MKRLENVLLDPLLYAAFALWLVAVCAFLALAWAIDAFDLEQK